MHNLHRSTSEKKKKLQAELENSGVQTRSFFYPMHMQPPLKKYSDPDKRCINAERLYETGLALPIHSGMSDDKIKYICNVLISNS